nr:unnamed protein product [Callosobruchus analis]
MDNIKEDVLMYVVPDDVQFTDILLGRSLTDKTNLAYVRIDDNLHFGYRDELPFCDIQLRDETRRIKLYADEDVILKGDMINLIMVTGEYNDLWPVMNSTTEDFEVTKGQCVFNVTERKIEIQEENLCVGSDVTMSMLNIDKSVSQNDSLLLMNLLRKFRDCFAMNLEELGCTTEMIASIHDNGVPVTSRPYKTCARDRDIINQIVSEWKRAGIVRETISPYCSPVLLVSKKTGDKRLVVDYRRLNSQTTTIHFPNPTIDSCLEGLSNCSIFTCLDLSNGYLQIPLDDESKAKNAFVTEDQTGEFERLVFGLKNAPAQFSHLMALVLAPLKQKGILVYYLDDVLIGANSWTEMLNKLEQTLQAFRNAKLTLKLEKCEFGREHVEFLGYSVNRGGISPGQRKTEAVRQYKRPETVYEVRRFLGLTSYFRRFVPNYAVIAKPLSDLTKKNGNFEWSKDQENAFDQLKGKLTSKPILKLYNPEHYTELHTDASSQGIAGMLLQKDGDGALQLVYCVSKKTTPSEANYHSSRLELLAVVWSVQRLRTMLLPICFTIVTDCQGIMYASKSTSSQVARWMMVLSEYNYKIVHRKGDRMKHVDALSRAPPEMQAEVAEIQEEVEEHLNIYMCITKEDYVEMMQHTDEKLKHIMTLLKKDDDLTKEEKCITSMYELVDGRLLRKVKVGENDRRLYVIPQSMRKSIVVKFHDQMGHYSTDVTVARILEHYWFAGMRRYVRRHIAACIECLYVKIPAGKKPGYLHPIPVPNRPFSRIHMDHTGPYITSRNGNTY